MNDINLPPDERFNLLYSQTETLALFQIDSRLRQGTKLKMIVKASHSMIAKVNNDYSEKNFPQAYLTALKTLITFNHIRTKHKEANELYKNLDQTDLSLVMKALTFGLDMAEKVKPDLERHFQKQYEEFVTFQKLQKEKKAIEEQEAQARAAEQQAAAVAAAAIQTPHIMPNSASTGISPISTPEIGAWKNGFPQPTAPQISAQAPARPPPPSYSRDLKPDTQNISGPNFGTQVLPTDQSPAWSYTSSKKLIIPSPLCQQFRSLAHTNSLKNIETCGFLFGERVNNTSQNPNKAHSQFSSIKKQYKITHLLLPRQSGTADTCNPLDEAEIIMFTSKYANLLQLGWIHTHPSQTAFLSSVDMHTQFGIQMLLPEAVAIVCSVKFNEDKFLKLSEYGFSEVQKSLSGANSLKSGNFHRYDNANGMQRDCLDEISFSDELLEVVDQR